MNSIDILVQQQLLAEDVAEKIRTTATDITSIREALLAAGLTEEDVSRAEQILRDIPRADIDPESLSKETLGYIPVGSAQLYGIVPLGVSEGALHVGILNPDNLDAKEALQFLSLKTGMPYKLFLITKEEYDNILSLYGGINEEVSKALSQLTTNMTQTEKQVEDQEVEENSASVQLDEVEPDNKDVRVVEDAPVAKIVNTMLRYAVEGNASDIHVEPLRESVRVRFRVDGILNTSLTLPLRIYSAIVARVKILSNMKLDEKRRPQDGRFSAEIEDRKIDFRVSTFPTYYGEKIVMRILDQGKGVRKLDDLGLTDYNLDLIRKAIKRPYGIILISGPTGSGKTTTLYSMLLEIDRDQKNVLSLEDPVEYDIQGISQSQVRVDIGYTFANGLRTALRQDPDIIMVGEIRDKETAQLAIQAALTGHLVLSTIHTNNAFGVIPRLIDMGVDPYLIAPTLVLAIAQRLVRALPDGVGRKIPVTGSIKEMIDKQFADLPDEYHKNLPKSASLFGIKQTTEYPSGTSGRTTVMEVLEMDKEIEQIVLKDPTEKAILEVARRKGMLTMKEDALIKSMQGKVPFEEVSEL